jgi:WXG100 family type VII secretion target
VPDPTGTRIVVPADLSAAGPMILGIANSIEDELNQLKAALAPLQETWTGQANLSWDALQMIWNTAAQNLMTGAGTLGAIGNTATTNWTNYSDCETANIATWAH